MNKKLYFICIALLFSSAFVFAQKEWVVYDESKIIPYELPSALTMENGRKVTTKKEWEKRRNELLTLFSDHMYGRLPNDKLNVTYKTVEQSENALDGKATRKQVQATFSAGGNSAVLNILIYLPKNAPKPVPLFFGLNFYGNQTVWDDEAILTNDAFSLNVEKVGVFNNRSSEATRGVHSQRWCVDRLIDAGYGVASVYYGEIFPDHETGFNEGVASLLSKTAGDDATRWGAIGAWSWGVSRIMDYLQTEKAIDAKRIVLTGHSRLGKTALWAGANDKRFAMVISNNSGCGGAAIFRRKIGETARVINSVFPYWFCENFKQYNDRDEYLPVDQHELIALIAPRPVYVASAEDDLWADPKGEFQATYFAGDVYRLFGDPGLPSEEMPPVNTPVSSRLVGYHIRTGEHDIKPYDWECFIRFADRYFGRQK